MNLGPKELMQKFGFLDKFKDQKWLSEESIKSDCNFKQLPLKAAFAMIKEIIAFIEKTKFNSRWEEGFSIKIRLQQIESLLKYFCEDTFHEKAVKGVDIIPQPRPIRSKPKSKTEGKVKGRARQP